MTNIRGHQSHFNFIWSVMWHNNTAVLSEDLSRRSPDLHHSREMLCITLQTLSLDGTEQMIYLVVGF